MLACDYRSSARRWPRLALLLLVTSCGSGSSIPQSDAGLRELDAREESHALVTNDAANATPSVDASIESSASPDAAHDEGADADTRDADREAALGDSGCTDRDGDGTCDSQDQCPDDPNKSSRGACGCSRADTDGDGDGTPDCQDLCPTDPAKAMTSGICGCGTADTDADADGTPDCHDQCPRDPRKQVPGVCGCGSLDVDADHDHTPDCQDQCPHDRRKTVPGRCGCDVAETDTDGDGTPDCIDQCPADPDKIAPGTCGCDSPDFPNFSAPGSQTMFVTSGRFSGALGAGYASGLEGADTRCQEAAESAGLGGRWMAVISDASTSAKDRVKICGSVKDVTGATLFTGYRDMFSSTPRIKLLRMDERGNSVDVISPTQPVWTGSDSSGATQWGATCTSWSTQSGSGRYGLAVDISPGTWLSNGPMSCGQTAHLYCISQPAPSLVSITIEPQSTVLDLSRSASRQFRLMATYSFGPQANLSEQASWLVDDPNLGNVSNAEGSRGLFTATAVGSERVSATYDGVRYDAIAQVVAHAHPIFMSSVTGNVASFNQTTQSTLDFYTWANDTCTRTANGAGLSGNFFFVNFGGSTFRVEHAPPGQGDRLAPVSIGGPIVNMGGEMVFQDGSAMQSERFVGAVRFDEAGRNVTNETAWGGGCGYDFSRNRHVASYSSTTDFDVGRDACATPRHFICVGE